jgi:hypothetical protein
MCVVALLVGNLMNKPALRARHRSASRLRDLRSSADARRSRRDPETRERDRGPYTIQHTFTHYSFLYYLRSGKDNM